MLVNCFYTAKVEKEAVLSCVHRAGAQIIFGPNNCNQI